MTQHAFIAMPFGTKPGTDGRDIDFNRIYSELLKPALEAAGCEVFRADEEQRAGDIRTDMFQELLVADLVLADLTLDNPNVWYELGVRHALRARGVVLVQGPRPTSPFDIYTDRKLRYRLKDGAPDPAFLAEDRAALTAMAKATLGAAAQRKV
ncbi:MAG: tetratricopeptide repeat protein, partial [Candidatus Dechloromonas phosphoritropha]